MIKELNLDIIAISETWLNEDNNTPTLNELIPKGMHFYGRNRLKSRGGGVGLLLKDEFFKNSYMQNDEIKCSFEHMIVSLKIKKIEVKIVVIYRIFEDRTFIEEMDSLLSDISIGSHILMLGDFNIHINNNSKIVKDFHNLLEEFNLNILNCPNTPTHEKGNVLDLIICSKDIQSKFNDFEVHDNITISDHYPVTIKLNHNHHFYERKLVCYKDYNKIDYENIGYSVQKALYENDLFNESIEQLSIFYNEVMSKTHENIPEKKFYLRLDKEEPWYNGQVNSLKKEKRRLERKYKRNNTEENKVLLKMARNNFTYSIRKSKRDYLQEKVSSCKQNNKSLYKLINPLIKKASLETSFNAESHANYFSEKIEKINEEILLKKMQYRTGTYIQKYLYTEIKIA